AMGGLWSATEKSMEAGKEKMKLQTLASTQEVGTALYDGLTKFATDTVFGTEVYDMANQMLANGIKDADVLPIMQQLGDISMGDANKLGSLSLAFAQINGKGKLAGQELLQLINAGFNPLQVLSEKTGESMESLTKRMEQ
ncbi:tape measure protein, partial [Riemerella anatipestifer]|nr:tape measure protein [Riemerella anatipestifer]